MSWDIDLVINTGIEEKNIINIGNYTYNVGGMYNKAMGFYLSYLNNKKCSKMINRLQKGVDEMIKNKSKYKKMNPKNGWGDYNGALKYLQEILLACRENPLCIIKVY